MMEGLGHGDHVVPGPERTLSHMGSSVDFYVCKRAQGQRTYRGMTDSVERGEGKMGSAK
jgi:hypothetical protein